MGVPSQIITRIRGGIRRLRNKIRKKYSKIRKDFRKWKRKNEYQLKEFKSWVSSVALYGVLVNIVATGIFGKPLTVFTVIGWGVCAYLVRIELPFVIRACQIRR